MTERILLPDHLTAFREHLFCEEKSTMTIEKYMRDAMAFFQFAGGRGVSKEITVAYKQSLIEKNYAVRSINSMLAGLNSLLDFLAWEDCKVKSLRVQRQTYMTEEKELTKEEYLRLLQASNHQKRLNLVIQTICGTGIRISELKYFTVEAVRRGSVVIQCKNKIRTILIPGKLKKLLLDYTKKRNIVSGTIFITRSGNPMDRSNIWSQMKALCKRAHVSTSKVFPHNLRKLFARTFYKIEKDIAKLADILGHGSVETTRIYIMTSGQEHRRKIERLGLVQGTVIKK